ncbi:hypothetical protein BpHYR1_004953 [Brachionus plicatilis]|uniref:Uncharacterized protein n=1 Tax=Brachionus plicatilis TaxID=10195 RepID=A0A3M7RJE2_BRAPC|nr:hypothetical protein BpHYR1_004953 [Brachionus plicatilis]
MKPEVLPDYNSSYTNTSNIENGLFSQPELDQQLKNIISLIQVGLIDPKENPIIIGTPKDDDSEKQSKLSLCDKLKIIGILVFLIIVTVVVTLCIIYMFVPFFARKNRNNSFDVPSKKSLEISSTCQYLDFQDEIFTSYFGLLQISSKNLNRTRECLGLLIYPNKLAVFSDCLWKFDVDFAFDKIYDKYSFGIFLGLKKYSQTIESLERYDVFKIVPMNLSPNSEMIEVEFTASFNSRYSCYSNSDGSDRTSEDLMCVRALKINDTVMIEKNLEKNANKCSNLNLKNGAILNSWLAFVPNADKKYQFIDLNGN